MIDIEELWDSEELSGTYFSANEKSPNYEKIVKKNQESNLDEFDFLSDEVERELTEKEIQAERRALRFK